MAKMNERVVRVGTIKKELYKLSKEDVESIGITYAMITFHRKYVHIRLYEKEDLDLELTWNEFRNISFLLDSLSTEELKYKC